MTLALLDLDYAAGMDRTRISTLLRDRRKALHKTLETCALAAGMTKGNWGHIESETTSPPIETLEKMARALDARWVVQLVAGGPRLDADRQALVDAITTQVDLLQDQEVRALLHQLAFYERERELRAATETQTKSKAK